MMSRMRSYAYVLAGIIGMAAGGMPPAAAFECPEAQAKKAQDVLPESDKGIAELSALLGSGDVDNRLEVIARDLKQKYPQANRTDLTNFMVAAYCPVVAADQDLNDAEKQARLDHFTDEVWQIYGEGVP